MKIIGYKTIAQNTQASLDSAVNDHIELNWQPFGSQQSHVCTINGEFVWAEYSQVMVKYEDN